MAIAYSVKTESTGSIIGSVTVLRAGGAISGNNNAFLICAMVYGGAMVTPHASWTHILTRAINGSFTLGVYWKLHTGVSEGASWSFVTDTVGTTRYSSVNIMFTGAATSTPIDVFDSQLNASSTSVVAPSIDPNYTNDMLVFFGGIVNTSTWTAPSGFTDPDGDGEVPAAAAVSLGYSYQLLSTGAATGTITGTASSAAANVGAIIAFKDASPVADSTPATGTISVGTATAAGLTVTGSDGGTAAAATISVATATADGVLVLARTGQRAFGSLVYSRALGVVGRKVG